MGVGFNFAYKLAQKVMIDDKPAIEDPAVRARLANWYVEEAGLKYTGYRTMTQEEMNEMFGGENPFSDFFQTFFGGGRQAPPAAIPGRRMYYR